MALLFPAGVALGVESRPLLPEEGAVVGPRPTLAFLVEDFKPTLRFSVLLSRDKFRKEIVEWDMRKSMAGWSLELDEATDKPVGGRLQVPRPLPEGHWQWRVVVHDSAADFGPDFSSSFQVDDTPPAEIDGLTVTYDKSRNTAKLRWRPPALDRKGAPETVSHYRIYRYDKRGVFPDGDLRLIGRTEDTEFEDGSAPTIRTSSPIAYYRVNAVDAAGNEVPTKARTGEASAAAPAKKKARPAAGAAAASKPRRQRRGVLLPPAGQSLVPGPPREGPGGQAKPTSSSEDEGEKDDDGSSGAEEEPPPE